VPQVINSIDWYFDFISPFSYLQAERLSMFPIEVQCQPVLFAGLLDHWEHKGPAEIGAKRRFTYRHVQWLAEKHGIPLRFPPVHPFNPLQLLRLSVALGNDRDTILKIFRFVWRDGLLPDSPDKLQQLASALGLAGADQLNALASSPEAKDGLRKNGESAIARGVFGVPTLMVGDELFWGFDATDMALDYLKAEPVFGSAEMRRVSDLPYGAVRGGKAKAPL
jgi:2-hydroxychromene-2-carboxylate isomerase